MDLKPGSIIWVPCEVKPGPFSNERLVRVQSSGESWVGFVDVRCLKDTVQEGPTSVRARVVSVEKESFTAELPGHSVAASRFFHGSRSNVTLAPLPA